MLNEERIRRMTQAAWFEEEEGQEVFRTNEFYMGDYISLNMVKALITGTFAFVILFCLWMFYRIEELLDSIQTMDIAQMGFQILKWYVIFLVVYEALVFFFFYSKYQRMREHIKDYQTQLREIEHLYAQEEQHAGGRRIREREYAGGQGEDDNVV